MNPSRQQFPANAAISIRSERGFNGRSISCHCGRKMMVRQDEEAMIHTRSVLLVGLPALLTLTVPLAAKAPTVKLTVSGGGLADPIDITSGTALKPSIWEGDFIGASATKPDPSLPRYMVSFFAKIGEKPTRMYVVYLVLDSRTGDGFVYLPGRGDKWYRQNTGTIIRDGLDGKWHHAAGEWSRAIAKAITH
jgi:hypothetical protein